MRQELQRAYEALQAGKLETAVNAVEKLKGLSRTEEGVFALTGGDEWELARYAYPLYAAYETACNKQAGYPDLVEQMKAWERKLMGEMSFAHVAAYLDMLIHTIDHTSPQIYEYYRELVELFRANVKKAIDSYFERQTTGVCCKVSEPEAEELFRGAVRRACDTYVLLAEKYDDLIL